MSTPKKNLAPIALELLIVIVKKSKTAFYTDLLQSHGSTLQVITNAVGTANQSVLEMLGLGETEQSAIFSIVRSDSLDTIMDELEKRFATLRNGKGIAMSVPLTSTIGTVVYGFLTGDERMSRNG